MLDVNVTVANGTPLNENNESAIILIEVTNTSAVPCKAGTDAYYYISLSDGTENETYTFVVTAPGTIDAAHEETFVVENTTLDSVTDSSGVIYYTAE